MTKRVFIALLFICWWVLGSFLYYAIPEPLNAFEQWLLVSFIFSSLINQKVSV